MTRILPAVPLKINSQTNILHLYSLTPKIVCTKRHENEWKNYEQWEKREMSDASAIYTSIYVQIAAQLIMCVYIYQISYEKQLLI